MSPNLENSHYCPLYGDGVENRIAEGRNVIILLGRPNFGKSAFARQFQGYRLFQDNGSLRFINLSYTGIYFLESQKTLAQFLDSRQSVLKHAIAIYLFNGSNNQCSEHDFCTRDFTIGQKVGILV